MVPPACSSKQTLENVAFLSSLRPANLAVSGQFRKIAETSKPIITHLCSNDNICIHNLQNFSLH